MSQAPIAIRAPKPGELALQLATSYLPTTAIYTATKLGLPELLAAGPQSAAELAEATGSNEDALYRVMRVLASYGILNEVGLRYFALTPAGEPLRADHPESVRDVVLFVGDPFHFAIWSNLLYSVKTGKPALEKVTGKPAFEYFRDDPEEGRVFNAAMTNLSAGLMQAVLNAYDFSGIRTLVDVAGGHGAMITAVLKKYPGMQGVLFETPGVLEGGKEAIQRAGLGNRCRTVAGSFFESLPPGGDAYFMQHIIHDWDDERAGVILNNLHRVLEGRPNGKVIMVDCVMQPGNQPGFDKYLDLEMLLMPGGRERTEEEWQELLSKSGFRLTRIVPTEVAESVIEAVPE